MIRFEDPLVLLLLMAIPAIGWLRARSEGRREATLRFSAVASVRAAGAGRRAWAYRIPRWLRGLALAAMVVALARPQTGLTGQNVLTEGIDIVLALAEQTAGRQRRSKHTAQDKATDRNHHAPTSTSGPSGQR